jgi:hypothetical protein
VPDGRILMLLPFVQFDFAGRLGLADGRYLARALEREETDRVLILQTLGAPHPGSPRLHRRRARRIDPPAHPETVPVTRATVAGSDPFEDQRDAQRWLARTADDRGSRVAEAKRAVALVNRALAALREATGDPLVHDVGASQAISIRIGWGTGDELADGRWSEARQLPPPPTPRRASLDPQQRVAEILAGREPETGEDQRGFSS